jgi:hypothetical protein
MGQQGPQGSLWCSWVQTSSVLLRLHSRASTSSSQVRALHKPTDVRLCMQSPTCPHPRVPSLTQASLTHSEPDFRQLRQQMWHHLQLFTF